MKKTISVLLLVLTLIFSFMSPAAASLRGDVDGTLGVSASDARLVLRAAVGLEALSEAQLKAAEADNIPGITASDARVILRAAAGLENLGEIEGVHVHSYKISGISREPSCTDKGIQTLICECGKEMSKDIAPLGHDYQLTGEEAPTCKLKGKKVFTCPRCQESVFEYIDKTDHNYQLDDSKPADCTTEGYNFYTCTMCGKAKKDTLSPVGHDYDTDNGLCRSCGAYNPSFCEEIPVGEKWIVADNWELSIEAVVNHPLHNDVINKDCGYTNEQCVLISFKVRTLGSGSSAAFCFTPNDFEIYDETGTMAAVYACDHKDYAVAGNTGTTDTGIVPAVLHNNSSTITFIVRGCDSDGVIRKACFTASIID